MSEYTEIKLVMMLCVLCEKVLYIYTVAEKPSHAKQLASCIVKPCVQNLLTVMIIHCNKYFVLFFMVNASHENIFSTKFSMQTYSS